MPSKKKQRGVSPATAARVRARVDEVLRIRLDGAEFWDVLEYARAKEQEPGSAWERKGQAKPLSDSQLRRYVQQADEVIAEVTSGQRKKLFREHLAKRRNLYAKSVAAGDLRAALAALRDEALLLNLYPPARVQNEHKGVLEIVTEVVDVPRTAVPNDPG